MAITDNDISRIRSTMREEIEEILEDKLTKLKSEFFDRVDPILKEVLTAREERPLIEKRLEDLEEIHPEGKHS